MFKKYFFAFFLLFALCANAPFTKASQVTAAEAYEVAVEGYTYFYSLLSMEITRRISTNAPEGKEIGRGPMNTMVHMKAFPRADFRDVVRPNFDTLYSVAWIDISKEPMVITHGDTNGRYFMLPFIDMWSNVFAVPGKRTSGTSAKKFLIVKQDWKGAIPKGMELIKAPTSMMWMIGRTQTNGESDYSAVHAIQDEIKIVPLSDWRSGKKPAVAFKFNSSADMKTPPLEQVNNLSAKEYFRIASELLSANPPALTDWSLVERLKKIGFFVGKSFDLSKQPKEIQEAVAKGSKDALINMAKKIPTLARVVNGWQMNTDTMGVYGNYYLKRAIVAMVGLGANQPEDAIYPLAVSDSKGNKLDGSNSYVIHFEKSELPPVGAFWSITMYDAQGFQVPNTLNRFAIGDRDSLKFNSDGSLDIYIQHQDPGGDRTANWLPSPNSGTLGVTMRLYAPGAAALDGRWNPPGIVKK